MMNATEQRFTYHDEDIRIGGVDCLRCGNSFFVNAAPEHQPKFCAYCGMKFRGYEAGDGGGTYKLNGTPFD